MHELGKRSDNFYAEMLFKTLGAEDKGKPARSGDGAQVVKDWLKSIGALEDTTVVTNGSGLFKANAVSAWTLTRVLRAAYQDPGIRGEMVAQLAVAGVDGSLRKRLRSLRRGRAVRAKTGTLDGVDSLSGYVFPAGNGSPLAFSFIVTGINDHLQVRRQIDRTVERIALTMRGP